MFGAGLLVGTALAVIIPEGVDAMYDMHSIEMPKPEFEEGMLSNMLTSF